jgi:hypothetical protein
MSDPKPPVGPDPSSIEAAAFALWKAKVERCLNPTFYDELDDDLSINQSGGSDENSENG